MGKRELWESSWQILVTDWLWDEGKELKGHLVPALCCGRGGIWRQRMGSGLVSGVLDLRKPSLMQEV